MTGVNQGTGGTGWLPGHRGNPGEGSAVVGGSTVPEVVDGAFEDPNGVASDTVDLSPVNFDPGDVMFLLLYGPPSTALETPPPGWENSRKPPDQNGMYLYSRRMTGNETTVLLSEPTTARRTLAALRNVDAEAPRGWYEDGNAVSATANTVNANTLSSSFGAYDTALFPPDYSLVTIGTNITDAPITPYAPDAGYVQVADYEPPLQYVNVGTGKSGFVQVVKNIEQKSGRRMGVQFGELTAAGAGMMTIAVGAPRTPAFKATPQIIGLNTVGRQDAAFAAELPAVDDVRPGDLQVWVMAPWVWNVVSGGSTFDKVENADIIGFDQTFASTGYATVVAEYDESHGTGYEVTGPTSPNPNYSRFLQWVRIVNHGTVFDAREGGMDENNGPISVNPVSALTVDAEPNDLLFAAAFGRSDLNGLVFATNPDDFEQLSSSSQTAGGAGGSLAMVKKNITDQDGAGTYTYPQMDHTNTASDHFAAGYGFVRVRPPVAAGQPAAGGTEEVSMELNGQVVATTSEPFSITVARIIDTTAQLGVASFITALTATESETVPAAGAATVTDAAATAEITALTATESETVASGTATVTDAAATATELV